MKQIVPVILAAALATRAGIPTAQATDLQQQTNDNRKGYVASGCATSSVKELYAMVKKPTTPIELLENLKFVADHHLLLREDFYTDENLMHIFGGSRIEWRLITKTGKCAYVLDLGDLLDRYKDYKGEGIYISWQTLDERKIETETGKIRAYISIPASLDSRITKDVIEKIFGHEWEITHPYQNDNPAHPQPANALGYDQFKLNVSTECRNTIVSFVTGSGGKVQDMFLAEEEK